MRASLIGGSVAFALSCGIPMERITAATGLGQGDLIDQEAWLPEALMPAIWRLIGEAFPGEPMGLRMAQVAPLTAFGPLFYIGRSAPTLKDALLAFARYRFTLSDNIEIEIAGGAGEVAVRIHHPVDEEDEGLSAEMGIALAARLARTFGAGDGPLRRVELRHGPRRPASSYEDFFRVPVRFGRSRNAMIFDAERLEQPTEAPDPLLCRYIEEHLSGVSERLASLDRDDGLGRVRAQLRTNAERGEYSAEALARGLGMTVRTLQRTLRAQGVAVRALIEEARMANAEALLGDPRLSIEEVAFLLGYSEDRAFRRAFQRWTGKSPARHRREGKAELRGV